MKWTLRQLQAAKREPIEFEKSIALDELKEQNQEIRSVSTVVINGKITYSSKVYTFDFTIKGELVLPCARTLVDVNLPFNLHATEQFREVDEYLLQEDDERLVSGDGIDLTPVIKEHILLEIPMQVFAEHVSEPAAPPSGKDWQLVTEEEKGECIDPRLADLAKFF